MSEVRLNFLNFAPDLEDEANPGLTVAQNVIHEPEGYKPLHLASAGSFATTGGLAASTATVTSLVAKPVGSGGDLFCAWIASNTLHVGINGVTAASLSSAGGGQTGYPLSFATQGSSQSITAFDVTEYAGKIFFVAEAQQGQSTPTTTTSLSHIGHMDY